MEKCDTNLFHLWLHWLRSLGGTFEPVRDLDEPKPRTGRRDPDKKPRMNPVGTNAAYWTAQANSQK